MFAIFKKFMPLTSKNPYNEQIIETFPEHTEAEIQDALKRSGEAFKTWRKTSFLERAKILNKLADLFERDKGLLAELITLEMGRPISFSPGEIEKCAWCMRFYAENGEKFLAPEEIKTDGSESFIRYEPIGPVLAIMPWNFPFWQVIRFLAPALMAGNTAILKHASNVPQCAMALEKLLREAGLPFGVFENLKVSGERVLEAIDSDIVRAVTITGSEKAGRAVASRAGANIKKIVLELGGSDPFIVCADADLEKIIPHAVSARLQNAGQTCIAAKRFLVHESLHKDFLEKLKDEFLKTKMGDPMDKSTKLGPLATGSIRDEIARLVDEAEFLGAKIIAGGVLPQGKGYFYPPTILTQITKDMAIYHEETFGPVAIVMPFKTFEEAVSIANDTRFGLGASVWTEDKDLAEKFLRSIESGCVFINHIVKSDPRLPFGGTKSSGFGRELSALGIREFTNIKTVYFA